MNRHATRSRGGLARAALGVMFFASLILLALPATSLTDRDPGVVSGGVGGNPSPTPPLSKQPPGPGDALAPGNGPDLELQILADRRWLWSLRTIDGRPARVGRTDTRGFTSIALGNQIMLLDVPEAGVFGLPVISGATVIVHTGW